MGLWKIKSKGCNAKKTTNKQTNIIGNNVLPDLTLITVDRFFGTGGFLIRYSNGHTK